MKFVAAGLMAAFALVLLMSENQAGEKAKFTISEVMLKAHKSGLWKKVAAGKGDDDDKKSLVEFYTALTKNTPPAGEEKEWKKVTGDMLKAAQGIAKGDEKAGKALQKVVNCGMCHKKFKG